AAGGRHAEQWSRAGSKDNDVVGTPRSTSDVVAHLGNRSRPLSPKVQALQRAVREEADRSAVGRPERMNGVFGARQRLCRGRIEGPQPQTRRAIIPRRDENELPPVR